MNGDFGSRFGHQRHDDHRHHDSPPLAGGDYRGGGHAALSPGGGIVPIDDQASDAPLGDISDRAGWPSREQFAVGPYLVQHRPTGAKFGAYPGERDVCYINWGRLAERGAAEDYRDELQRIARELLRERVKF